MVLRLRQHLADRMVAMVLTIVFIITASLSVFFVARNFESLDEQHTGEGLALVQSIASSSELGVIAAEPAFLEAAISVAMDHPNTDFIAIYDTAGRIIQSASRVQLSLELPEDFHHRIIDITAPFVGSRIELLTGNVDNFFAPVRSEVAGGEFTERVLESGGERPRSMRTIGLVRLGLTRGRIDAALKRSILFAVPIFVAVLVLGVVMAVYLSRRIVRPLAELEEGAKRIASGSRDVELPVTTGDEIGSVSQAFNTMVSALRDTTVSMHYVEGIIQSMNDLLITADAEGRLTNANDTALQMLGYMASELRGRPLESVFVVPEGSFEERIWRPLLEKGRLVEQEAVCTSHAGKRFVVGLTAAVLRDAEGTITDVIVVARDITERKRAEESIRMANEELMRLNTMRSEFTSMVSHELRTPLSAIKEGIDIVLEGIDGPITDAQGETLGIAKRSVDRLARLINNILDFTKLESGRMRMTFEPTDLKQLAQEMFDFMRPRAERAGLDYTIALPEGPVIAACDADRIKQVLLNLLDNAVKFTSAGGRVAVALAHDEGQIRFAVADSGVGIRTEEQAKIFEVYAQLSTRGFRKTGGSGLGLTICKQIVERHGGQIGVESAEGKGSTFRFSFPDDLQASAESAE